MTRKLPDYRQRAEVIAKLVRQAGHDIPVDKIEYVISAYERWQAEVTAKLRRSDEI
jgi:hypothetical protein